jgi:hypothetical protein
VRRLKFRKLPVLLAIAFSLTFPRSSVANCKDPDLRKKVTQTAREEGVNENELFSIIAHESGCRYYTVAWNQPGSPQTAKSKFLDSLEEAKTLAEYLIATKKFRVDIGIGQINNEAHVQPKGWSLYEVLNPKTALNRVAQVLKERGWKNYHSSNPVLAKKWQVLALAALDRMLLKPKNVSVAFRRKSNLLLVFNASPTAERNKNSNWVVYGD